MKTTVDIPDELFRRAKAYAAAQGVHLRELFEKGIRLAMGEESKEESYRVELPIVPASGARRITVKMIREAEKQMDEQEAERVARHMRR